MQIKPHHTCNILRDLATELWLPDGATEKPLLYCWEICWESEPQWCYDYPWLAAEGAKLAGLSGWEGHIIFTSLSFRVTPLTIHAHLWAYVCRRRWLALGQSCDCALFNCAWLHMASFYFNNSYMQTIVLNIREGCLSLLLFTHIYPFTIYISFLLLLLLFLRHSSHVMSTCGDVTGIRPIVRRSLSTQCNYNLEQRRKRLRNRITIMVHVLDSNCHTFAPRFIIAQYITTCLPPAVWPGFQAHCYSVRVKRSSPDIQSKMPWSSHQWFPHSGLNFQDLDHSADLPRSLRRLVKSSWLAWCLQQLCCI